MPRLGVGLGPRGKRRGTPQAPGATIHNTAANSSAPGTSVAGFGAPADNIDARLSALGG